MPTAALRDVVAIQRCSRKNAWKTSPRRGETLRRSTQRRDCLLTFGCLLDVEVSYQPVQVVGVNAEGPGCFGVIATGGLECIDHDPFLGLLDCMRVSFGGRF